MKDYLGGTHGYLAPERYGNDKYETGLQPTDDVFALAMTFAELEGDFDIAHQYIKNKCFEFYDIETNCKVKINAGLDFAFTEGKKLLPIRKIIDEALATDPSKRIQSMEDFSRAIIGTLGNFDGAREYVADVIASGENFDENSSLPSFWKHSLVKMNDILIEMQKKKQIPQPKKQEEETFFGGLFKSIGKYFGGEDERNRGRDTRKAK